MEMREDDLKHEINYCPFSIKLDTSDCIISFQMILVHLLCYECFTNFIEAAIIHYLFHCLPADLVHFFHSGFWPTLAVFLQRIPIFGWLFQQPFVTSVSICTKMVSRLLVSLLFYVYLVFFVSLVAVI